MPDSATTYVDFDGSALVVLDCQNCTRPVDNLLTGWLHPVVTAAQALLLFQRRYLDVGLATTAACYRPRLTLAQLRLAATSV